MAGSTEELELRERMGRIESLLLQVDEFEDPNARSKTREIVQTLMQLHEAGLERMLSRIASTDAGGVALIDSLARDEIISSLLLLYGLHPVDLETRVNEALVKVRPALASHGGDVELLGIDDGLIRLRLQGSCNGCPSSASTLKQTVEEAILEKAPDAAGIYVEGVVEQVEEIAGARNGRFALPIVS